MSINIETTHLQKASSQRRAVLKKTEDKHTNKSKLKLATCKMSNTNPEGLAMICSIKNKS